MRAHVALGAAVALALAACAPLRRDDPELEIEPPESWDAPASEGPVEPEAWWESFERPELGRAIDEALAANPDLAAAAERVLQAAALARIAGADRLPALGAGASASREQQVFTGISIPGSDGPLQSLSSSYGVSLDVSWELDLWGRLAARAKAAEQDREASEALYESARESLAAQTAKVWIAWIEARAQVELAERTVQSFEQTDEVVRRRWSSGRGSAFEVRLAESELAAARSNLARFQQSVARLVRQLQILLGRYPSGSLELEASLPETPPLPAAGLPSELLMRRPDLRAAELELRAADSRLYEARAELWPRVTLLGSVGRRGSELSDLSSSDFDVWSLAGGLTQPIFEGGRLRAGVDLSQARVREALELWRATVLAAFSEVEILLSVEQDLVRQEVEDELGARRASEALELVRARYARGLEDVTSLLVTQRRAITAEITRLETRRRRLEARVDLHLALGGGLPPSTLHAANELQGSEDDR